MAKRQSLTIDGQHFPNKVSLASEIRHRIATYEDAQPFSPEDEAFFRDLLDRHPNVDIKIGAGVRGFYAKQNPVYKQTRCLYLVRVDGSSTDWSWTECLRPTPHDKKVRRAFRALLEPQMIRMKQRFFDTAGGSAPCPVTGEPMVLTSAHVDHIPPQTFETLFQRFVQEEEIDLAAVILNYDQQDNIYQDTVENEALAARWLAYHEQYAKLRVISAQANLSDVKRGAGR